MKAPVLKEPSLAVTLADPDELNHRTVLFSPMNTVMF
jgi:hypothetical protein